jgi:hypothetical protein
MIRGFLVALTALSLTACTYSETNEVQLGVDPDGCKLSRLEIKGEQYAVIKIQCGCTVSASSQIRTQSGKVSTSRRVASVTISRPD